MSDAVVAAPVAPGPAEPVVGHCVLSRALDRHTEWGPKSPTELARWLKHAALFYRHVVVPDSDLNHNPVFASALGHQAFEDAVESGFVRRTARAVGNAPVSQTQLYEQFRTNAPWAVSHVREEAVRALDARFERAERTHAPLLWHLDDAAKVFGERVIVVLEHAKTTAELHTAEQGALADRVITFVSDAFAARRTLTARAIEDAVFGRRGSDASAAHKAVWGIVVEAYGGNLRYVHHGICASDPLFEPRGEQPHFYEQPHAADLAPAREAARSATPLGEFPVPVATEIDSWEVVRSELDRLPLEAVLELRDQSKPDAMFALRHQLLIAGAQADEGRVAALHAAANAYLEELHRNHRALVLALRDDAIRRWRSQFRAPQDASRFRRGLVKLGSGFELANSVADALKTLAHLMLPFAPVRDVAAALLIIPKLVSLGDRLASRGAPTADDVQATMALRAFSQDPEAGTLMVADRELLRRAADHVVRGGRAAEPPPGRDA